MTPVTDSVLTQRDVRRRDAAGRGGRRRHPPGWLGALALLATAITGTPELAVARIDTDAVWRSDGPVFSDDQLAVIEKILTSTRCRNEKSGCGYRHDGKPARRGTTPDIRVTPWPVSSHAAYLVRADFCGAGGCDEGLFVRIDNRWRLLIESFGILEREKTTTRGFRDLRFRPRGADPFRLLWTGRGYVPEKK